MKSYDSLYEIRDYLIPLGFIEFDPPGLSSFRNVDRMFQKKYKDDSGIKYFIDANVFDFTFTNAIPEQYHVEFEGQFYQKETHNAINFTFIDWELNQVEEFLDKMFDNNLLENYENDEGINET